MPPATASLEHHIAADELDALIARARAEDMGPAGLDVTSEATIDADRSGHGQIVARQAGTVAGLALLERVAAAYDPAMVITLHAADGEAFEPGSLLAECHGRLRPLLAMERVALNFVGHLSGVATLTAAYVARVAGAGEAARPARICDTRKTIPGLRALQKYAVACGGGLNHRMGLNDAVLIKDNHLASVAPGELGAAVAAAIERARQIQPRLELVEVEVDTLEQLDRVLGAGATMILLDNMTPAELARAVAMRDQRGTGELLEASGGVSLATVAEIAATGVDRISVGALTHSAPALDVALDVDAG